ncbi:hypothetical protein ACTXT7_013716 [Hymenolepis weldensis]
MEYVTNKVKLTVSHVTRKKDMNWNENPQKNPHKHVTKLPEGEGRKMDAEYCSRRPEREPRTKKYGMMESNGKMEGAMTEICTYIKSNKIQEVSLDIEVKSNQHNLKIKLHPSTGQKKLPRATVCRMEWHLDDAFQDELLLPQNDFYENQRADIQVACLAEEGGRSLSRSLCNRAGVSSDAMMQIAFLHMESLLAYLPVTPAYIHSGTTLIQHILCVTRFLELLLMAHEKVHGESGLKGGSTEVCSTRSFRGGGEALARPLTEEVRGFRRMLRSEKILGLTDENDLLESLKQCSRAHRNVIREAAAGYGE